MRLGRQFTLTALMRWVIVERNKASIMKSARRSRTATVRRGKAKPAQSAPKRVRDKVGLDPQFIAAAKASRKKFGALFKRLAKT